jgi:hypothetical protein
MTDNSEARQELESVFQAWKDQHQELLQNLDGFLDQLRDNAASDQASVGGEHELVGQLNRTREKLQEHFIAERQMNKLLKASRGKPTPEINSLKQKAESEHRQLLSRLEGQVESIASAYRKKDPSRWLQSVDEINLFLDALEQHEDQEADNIRWLMSSH